MLPKPLRVLWGDLTADEIKKFGILTATLFLIIGTYWMLRVMKDASFGLLVGYKYQPMAKMASLVFVALAVLIYSKLVDLFSKHTLFYIICTFYGLGFITIAYLMSTTQPINAVADAVVAASSATTGGLSFLFSWIPGRILGWFSYLFLESFGSIVPALFWSFVASSTTTESAKRGYGMIISCTQVGTILGPLLVSTSVKTLGVPTLFAFGGILICLVPMLIRLYMKVVPQGQTFAERAEAQAPAKKTGLFEGLRLLLTRSYLLGILVVATMYEVIGTIVEFQMGMCINEIYPPSADGGAAFAQFKAWNGVAVGILALVFALVGTSYFMRKFGLKFCLISFPVLIGVTMISVYVFNLSSGDHYKLMWAFFIAVVIFKGLNYALNNPSKEVMYIPTSKDVKFKAKGWIDAFGNRTAKAGGALVTDSLKGSLPTLINYGTIASLGIVGFWVLVAAFVGNTNAKLQKENRIIE